MSGNSRKQASNEFAEQRLRERLKLFITDVLKSPEDVIVSDICSRISVLN